MTIPLPRRRDGSFFGIRTTSGTSSAGLGAVAVPGGATVTPTPSPASSVATPPPAGAVPPVPNGFVQPNMADLRGVRPSTAELVVAPGALQELQGFVGGRRGAAGASSGKGVVVNNA